MPENQSLQQILPMELATILAILEANGIDAPGKIVRTSNQELLKLKGIGEKSVQVLRQEFGPPLTSWPVDEQCAFLGIPYEKIKAKWDAYAFHKFNWYCEHTRSWLYPEDYVLNRYLADGWNGVNSEGHFILTILKLLTQDGPSRDWTPYFYCVTDSERQSSSSTYLQAKTRNVVPNLLACTEDNLVERFVYCKNLTDEIAEGEQWVRRFSHAKDWPTELIVEAYRAMTKERLLDVLRLLMQGGERRRYGWPDLTLVRDGHVKLVEVKTTDRLGVHQIDLWDNVLQPLEFDVTVVQVKPALLGDANSRSVC